MGDGPLCPAGQGLLQNHLRRFPVFFQMPRDKVVDEPSSVTFPFLELRQIDSSGAGWREYAVTGAATPAMP